MTSAVEQREAGLPVFTVPGGLVVTEVHAFAKFGVVRAVCVTATDGDTEVLAWYPLAYVSGST